MIRTLRNVSILMILSLLAVAAAAAAQGINGSRAIEDGATQLKGSAAGELDAEIYLSVKEEDEEGEVIIEVEGEFEDGESGLRNLVIMDPRGRVTARIKARARGLSDFILESPDPGLRAILLAFPEGEYTFTGKTRTGDEVVGTAELSHDVPDAAELLTPEPDSTVSISEPLVISWTEVDDADAYIVEVEVVQEGADGEDDFEAEWILEVPGDFTSVTIPAELTLPDAEYAVEIAVEGDESENFSVTEAEFSTEE